MRHHQLQALPGRPEGTLKESLMEVERFSDSQAKGTAIDIVDFWHGAAILDVWALEGGSIWPFAT